MKRLIDIYMRTSARWMGSESKTKKEKKTLCIKAAPNYMYTRRPVVKFSEIAPLFNYYRQQPLFNISI